MTEDVTVITFGCRLNTYEAEVMRAHAQTAGLRNLVILNGCAVTSEAERQLRQAIRKTRRERSSATIVVTGCAAQVGPEKYKEMAEVDYVIGNKEKLNFQTYLNLKNRVENNLLVEQMFLNDSLETLPIVSSFEGRSRAYIQIQTGCDHCCTFCIIPRGRGPSRSLVPQQIIEQVLAIAARDDYPEIVLTGVDIASYGKDLDAPISLGKMVRELLQTIPSIQRLRLSSLDPAAIDEELLSIIINEPRFMPCVHLSVQAGDDMILKRMRRRHRRQQVIDLCNRIRSGRPEIVFGADLIAGFPTETEEMFMNTLRLVDEASLTWLHVFPYSSRDATPASRMPQIGMGIRRLRAAALREKGVKAVHAHLDSLVGKIIEVHVEQPFFARTPSFAEVNLDVEATTGSVIAVRIMAREGERLKASRVCK